MKTKTVKFEELKVGDWFTVEHLGAVKLIVVKLNKLSKSMEATSPEFISNNVIHMMNYDYDYELIGTSKPNFWYKFFFKFDLICPYKMVDLD